MIDIKNKVAIITGASRGIGYVIAKELAKKSVKLSVSASSIESLKNLKIELDNIGAEYIMCPANLMEESAASHIIKKTIEKYGKLDFLINNAGIAKRCAIEETDAQMWDRHMIINAKAPFLLSKEALKHLKESDVASIINIASVVGRKGYENQGAYSASKHALMGLTKVLAKEYQKHGIRVHAISPGGVLTEMVKKTRPDLNEDILIKPKEIAEIVLFLLTHRGVGVIDEINIRRDESAPFV